MNYTYDKVIKRVHPEWLNFFESNKDELEIIFDIINKDITEGKTIFPLPKNLLRTFYFF